MKSKIIYISDSDKHFSLINQEYIKRLQSRVELIQISPYKSPNRDFCVLQETKKIIQTLSTFKWYKKILLDKSWQLFTSEDFAKKIQNFWNVCFIIWWPFWVNYELLDPQIDMKISFWTMTFPHSLAKAMLLEQLYRSRTLWNGKEYHY